MKKTKLIVAALLATAMSISLIGCGTNTTTEQPTTAEAEVTEAAEDVVVEDTEAADEDAANEDAAAGGAEGNITLGWWGNPTRNEQTTAVRELFQAENPDVTVEELTVGWADYWTQLATLAASGDLPDVVQMDISTLEEYVENAQLKDLTPLIESGQIDLSNVPESVVELGRVGDGIYAISIGQNAPAMIYNKTLLDEMGIEVSDNMTTDEFVEIAKKVYDEKGIRTNFALSDPSNPLEFMLRGEGVNWLSADGMGGEAAQYEPFFDLVVQGAEEGWGYDPANFIGRMGSVEQDPMVAGGEANEQSWCTFGWSNGLTGLQDSAPDGMELSMTAYPSANPAESNYVRASMYFSIAEATENVDAAAALISFWTNSVDANKIMLGERGVPASGVVAEALTGDLTPEAQIMFGFVQRMTENTSVPYALRPAAAGEINDQLRLLVENVYAGKTAADAAQELVDFGNNLL